ncbi:MAG TPA: EamA family transporter [Methanoregula sp.]|nr:EamA family transporter [Methanoregula sp.]
MLWALLAIIGAAANAAYYILIKRTTGALDPKFLTGAGFIAGSVVLFSLSAVQGFPRIGPDYVPAVIASAFLNIVGLHLIFAALSESDLSLSMPMLSFTPAFLIGTSYLLLGETPSLPGMVGIFVIVGGSYVLNISAAHEHFLDPVRSMLQNRGSWYMLIVAFLFAVSINFDKIALLNSDAVFGMALTLGLIGGALLVMASIRFLYRRTRSSPPETILPHPPLPDTVEQAVRFRSYFLPALLVAVFAATESVSINVAYTLQIVPYVISLKRLGILFMVLYGTVVCRENELVTRFAGSAMMVGGAVIILLFA